MSAHLSRFLLQRSRWLVAFLIVCWVAAEYCARGWQPDVGADQLLALPARAPSRQADALFEAGFSRDLMSSSVFVVARRPGRTSGLTETDRDFITQEIVPRLRTTVESYLRDRRPHRAREDSVRIYSPNDGLIGALLRSRDERAALIIIQLPRGIPGELMTGLLTEIEQRISQQQPFVFRPDNLFAQGGTPPGLALELSGLAFVSRDLARQHAREQRRIRLWIMTVTPIVLLMILRMPLAVLMAVISAVLSERLFRGILSGFTAFDIDVSPPFGAAYGTATIWAYAAILTYHRLGSCFQHYEQLGEMTQPHEESFHRVSRLAVWLGFIHVLLFSAMFVCSISSFRAYAVTQCLAAVVATGVPLVVLSAIPANGTFFLFWPQRTINDTEPGFAWSTGRRSSRIPTFSYSQSQLWRGLLDWLFQSPRRNVAVIGLLLACAVIVAVFDWPTPRYQLSAELPDSATSLRGAAAVQDHFPPGTTAPTTLLIHAEQIEFNRAKGTGLIQQFVEALAVSSVSSKVSDIRSLATPLGRSLTDALPTSVAAKLVLYRQAVTQYVADTEPYQSHVTRIDFILADDPFSESAVETLLQLKDVVRRTQIEGLAEPKIYFRGATAEIIDLQSYVFRDQLWIILLNSFCMLGLCLLKTRNVFQGALLTIALMLVIGSAAYLSVLFSEWFVSAQMGYDWKLAGVIFPWLTAMCLHWFLLHRSKQPNLSNAADDSGGTAEFSASIHHGVRLALLFCFLFATWLTVESVSARQAGVALIAGVLLCCFLLNCLLLPIMRKLLAAN